MKTIAPLPSSNKMWPYFQWQWLPVFGTHFTIIFFFRTWTEKKNANNFTRFATISSRSQAQVSACRCSFVLDESEDMAALHKSAHRVGLGGALIIWVCFFLFSRAREEVTCESLNRSTRYFVGFILISNTFCYLLFVRSPKTLSAWENVLWSPEHIAAPHKSFASIQFSTMLVPLYSINLNYGHR